MGSTYTTAKSIRTKQILVKSSSTTMAVVGFSTTDATLYHYELGSHRPPTSVPMPELKELVGVRVHPVGGKIYVVTATTSPIREGRSRISIVRMHPDTKGAAKVSLLPRVNMFYDQHLTHPEAILFGQVMVSGDSSEGKVRTILHLYQVTVGGLEKIWSKMLEGEVTDALLPEKWPVTVDDVELHYKREGPRQMGPETIRVHIPITAYDRLKYKDVVFFVAPTGRYAAEYVMRTGGSFYRMYVIQPDGTAAPFGNWAIQRDHWLNHPFVHLTKVGKVPGQIENDRTERTSETLPENFERPQYWEMGYGMRWMALDTVNVEKDGPKLRTDLADVLGTDMAGYAMAFYLPNVVV